LQKVASRKKKKETKQKKIDQPTTKKIKVNPWGFTPNQYFLKTVKIF
jgi:hypothetical protein